MNHPTASPIAVLDAWDRASGQPLWARPLTVLSEGGGIGDFSSLAELPLGALDDRLLELRTILFGARAEALVACPTCGELAEVALALDELRRPTEPDATTTIHIEGRAVELRPPTTADLAAVADESDPQAALLERCARMIDGSELELPAAADAVGDAIAELDPGSDVVLTLSCPVCGHECSAPLAMGSFLWDEIDAWARSTLSEVDALARAYGWTEAEVMALSASRRQRYLELAAR